MKKSIATIALMASTIVLAGCSSTGASSTETTSPLPVSGVPRLSVEQVASLRSELGKVHPALDHERSEGRARNVCMDLLMGEQDEAAIVERARQRFEGGSTGPLSQTQAASIVAVIKANGFCVKR